MISKTNTFLLVPVFLMLSGCASLSDIARTKQVEEPQPEPIYTDLEGRPVADLVAQYAMSNPPGTRGPVTSADNDHYIVEIGRDYVAATQQSCRRISLESVDGQSTLSAVCQIEDIWQTVLWP